MAPERTYREYSRPAMSRITYTVRLSPLPDQVVWRRSMRSGIWKTSLTTRRRLRWPYQRTDRPPGGRTIHLARLVDPAAPDNQIPIVKHHSLSWRDGELWFLEDEFSPITARSPHATGGGRMSVSDLG